MIEWGAGDRAVLVHGSFGWGESTWHAQRPLAERFRLVLVDRRGFGGSAPDGRVDFERDADDVASLLDESSHLVGHSYGGVVSLLAASRRPDAVRSLTVIEPPAFGLVRGDAAVEELLSRIRRAADDASDAAEYHRRFLEAFGLSAPPGRLTELALQAAEASWRERRPDEADVPLRELAATPFPKLVVRGAWDKAPPDAQRVARPAFHAVCDVLERELRAESAVFAGAAHRPQELGRPFNERLRAFWEAARR